MGILSRFSDIMRSNVNAMLDKLEDPSKMVDQMLLDLRKQLADVKNETAGVMADARSAQRRVDDMTAQINKYQTAAENALKSGNEDDARSLVSQKQQLEQTLIGLTQTAQLANDNANKMRQMHDKLVNDIAALEARRSSIKAKTAAAKAQEHVNKVLDGGTKASASIETFNRLEEKADKALDQAMAHADLNADINAGGDLAAKYAGGVANQSVDDELAAMKAKLGIG